MRTGVQQRTDWIFLLGALGLSVVVTAVLVYYRDAFGRMGDWGYLGAFLSQVINSATILVPAIGQAFIVGFAATLNPWLLGLIGGIGATLGEIVGYVVGVGGHHAGVKEHRYYNVLRSFTNRWGGVTFFVFAATPLPFDVAGIWAGSVRYPLWRFLLYTTAGKVVQVTALALAGLYGIAWIESTFT